MASRGLNEIVYIKALCKRSSVVSSLYYECDEVMAMLVRTSILRIELAMLKRPSFPEREVLQS